MNVSEQKAEKLAKKMNKYLADSLAGLNLVLAILDRTFQVKQYQFFHLNPQILHLQIMEQESGTLQFQLKWG